MIHVAGPNIMSGYLGQEERTAKAMHGEWYITGDIGSLDEDGFLTITDRLARFSKIGGEMVPHGRVEEALHEAAGQSDLQVFSVTGVPDEKKGERLVVLHTLDPAELPAVLAKLRESGLPNLFIPRAEQFIRIDAIPILGTGKTDLKAVKAAALADQGA
jgi:acyl-[acyl-carrier-protein]-phospholipid O-acyltransferase/long-chain-fatty-acid--[acyl-carrier-protein] ligase